MRLDGDDVELLACLARGMTREHIARRLDVSQRTLRRQTRDLCDRLGVETVIEAVAWAARRQLI